MARMYYRTGLSTKCTRIKNGFKNLRTGTETKIRPFVDALKLILENVSKSDEHIRITGKSQFSGLKRCYSPPLLNK